MENKYMVFTRKWRPKTFEEIIGQDQVIIPLKRAIEINRIMQAYLFSGPRGTGKTTTARIFAKALNCVKGPTVNPCNKCDICNEISDGSSLDVIEIDGASNRGIDEIRQLRESVGFGAAKGKYKIYIIDEVHMLTKEAFNALLKTLEEPPQHVIFIFATTDPQQIPQTILSRCQQFKFKKLTQKLIYENLKFIAKNENIEVDDNAIAIIAKSVDGALRDAQRIFDQSITYAKNEKVTEEIVRNLLGAIKIDMLKNVFKSEILKKPEDALVILGESEKKHPITVPQETYVHYTYNLEATAYDPSPESNSLEWAGITKLGWRTRYGIAAVDPKVIALRSLLYIEGYGFAWAGDTGGAIKGKRIDLCYNTTEEALKWGRRKTKVYVLGKKPLNTKKD